VTPAEDLPALHTVVTGGEPVSAEVAARWRAGRRLINVYGTTEGTVATTAGEVGAGPRTIGRALAHARTYVPDARQQPAPVGVPASAEVAAGGRAGRRRINVDGTTEGTVATTAGEVGAGPLTVGRARAHARTYVVDARQQPVPVGVTGELYIGGAGVARGYVQ